MCNIIEDFRELISSDQVAEQNCQDFLEKNTELIYTPFLLNHWLHFDSVISKFPLDTSLVTDFVYLTKCSNFWYVILVELEHPSKNLFRNNSGRVIPTADLTEAIAQVHSWKDFIRRNRNEVLRRLTPIRKPLGKNSVFFKYLLVLGRNDELSRNQSMRDRLASLGNNSFRICTYDSLISAYIEGPREKKNIIRLKGSRFEIKHLHAGIGMMLAHLTPEDLSIPLRYKKALIAQGYEIDKWKKGKLLTVNGKTVTWPWPSDLAFSDTSKSL